jgi:transcription initiation factor TFIIE subunit beta
MALNASLNKFRTELSDATSRNIAHSRPSSAAPARTSTPKPGEAAKRTHDAAFSAPPAQLPSTNHGGSELLTQVWNAVKYLKDKEMKPVPFDQLIGYLSLPNDAEKNIPLIKRALIQHHRAQYLTKDASPNGKESFRYMPMHAVTNAEELKDYLARQPTAQGIPVRDLKDGWPDCAAYLDALEREGAILVTRNKKDNTPRMVWTDSPTYHILNATNQQPQKADSDFVDVWSKTKLPGSEMELRTELEKAGLTPSSQVKEVRKVEAKRKEKRRINRKGGKTTNSHMLGILKDYSKR